MAYVKPGSLELKFAYRLLLYMHANVNNTYLLLAVIAWVRSESGRNYIGNNPLNLRPGNDDAKYRSGVRKGRIGYFSVYKSLDAAAHATANRLVSAGHDYRGYGLMVDAARRDAGEKDYAKQAMDFLMALVLSKWDAGHYGLSAKELKDPNSLYKTTIYAVWSGLLGHKITLPADTIQQPKKRKPPPAPHQPRSLKHTIPSREYIQPYAALGFYEARHKAPGDGTLEP